MKQQSGNKSLSPFASLPFVSGKARTASAIYRKALRLLTLLTLLSVSVSCGNTEYEYSSNRVYFVFDNSTHHNANLASAMTPYSNVFATIRQTHETVSGSSVSYIAVTSSQGNSTEKSILNAVDLRRTIILGHRNGIIVGYGNLSDPLTFYAYDLECPNCFDPSVIPYKDYYLSVNSQNKAVCSTCQREYDLNNGGIITSGDQGKKLTRYRATTTGPFGVLTVN